MRQLNDLSSGIEKKIIRLKETRGAHKKTNGLRVLSSLIPAVVPDKKFSHLRSLPAFHPVKTPWIKKHTHLAILLSMGLVVVFGLNMLFIAHRGAEWKTDVALAAKSGFEALLTGGVSFAETNLENAALFFEKAKSDFKTAEKELWFLQRKAFFSAASFVEAGEFLAEAGAIFTESTKRLQIIPKLFLEKSGASNTASLGPSITEILKQEITRFETASKKISEAASRFHEVNVSLIPQEFRKTFFDAREKLKALDQQIESALLNIPAVLNLLGDERPHRYLILLQNRYELRPTGGFIGSYILATFNDGYLTEFEPHDVYSSDYQLSEHVQPPEEFRPLVSRWFLRDSNYHPHFPVSAKRAAWFLQKENGPSVDSVIAIDQSVVEDLLRVTGPIFFEPFGREVSADNFSFIFSYVTEAKTSGREDPKKLLKDFIKKFEKELLQKADFANIAAVIAKAAREKHLMAYSEEKEVQNFFSRNKTLAGLSIPDSEKTDYLQVVNYNVGGNKSDRYITQKIKHETFFMPDETIENVVTIVKTHHWNKNEEQKQREILASFGFESTEEKDALDNKLRWILGEGNNFSAMRIYVPAGSEILKVTGSNGTFEVTAKEDPEFPDTKSVSGISASGTGISKPNYFAAKMDVKAGQTVTLQIRYRLQWKLNFEPTETYRFLFQKQPGMSGVEFEKKIYPRPNQILLRHIPEISRLNQENIFDYSKYLISDFELATLWK